MEMHEAIQKATEASDLAPEGLKEVTFKTVLEHLLRGEMGGTGEAGGRGDVQGFGGGAVVENQSVNDGLPDPDLVKRRGSRAQQAIWAMLTLHARGMDATTEEIISLIRQELGIAPQSVANTGRTLRELTPRYVMRRDRQDGRGYVYEPTARSPEIFEGLA